MSAVASSDAMLHRATRVFAGTVLAITSGSSGVSAETSPCWTSPAASPRAVIGNAPLKPALTAIVDRAGGAATGDGVRGVDGLGRHGDRQPDRGLRGLQDREPKAAWLSGADCRVKVTLMVLVSPGRVKFSSAGVTVAFTPGTATLAR